MNSVRIDLHTHSTLSHDGGISATEYQKLLKKVIDVVAITDHNSTEFAKKLHKKIGNLVIVGEEIDTGEGEIIGLFLDKTISSNLGIKNTVKEIRKQKAFVYIPHPLDPVRKGVSEDKFEKYHELFDIVETHNQRAILKNSKGTFLANKYEIFESSASDAHGFRAVGKSYLKLDKIPSKNDFLELLDNSSLVKGKPGIVEYFYPFVNKLKKLLKT